MACCTYTFRISPPRDINDLFIRWSKVATKKYNSLLLTAASALCWAIWITRNEVVFDKCRPKSFLQVLFRGTHWLQQWARLQRHNDLRDQLIIAGHQLCNFLVLMDGYQQDILVMLSLNLILFRLPVWLVVNLVCSM